MTLAQILMALPALALVLGLALLAGRLAQRFGLNQPRATTGRIVVLEQTALDGRRRLHLIRCEGRDMLLVTGASGDLVLGSWPAATEATLP